MARIVQAKRAALRDELAGEIGLADLRRDGFPAARR
jgi:hypothetical protein